MNIHQISVFLENRAGKLAEITDLLAENGINLRAISIAETADYGLVRLIVDDYKRASEILTAHGAVSEPCARAMAEGVRALTGADIALAVTGVAGPDPDERGNAVGLVFIALAAKEGTWCRRTEQGNRRRDLIREHSVNHAYDMLRRYLTGLPVE